MIEGKFAKHGCCFIVPPYVLEAMREHADEQTRTAAHWALEATRMLMKRRLTIGPEIRVDLRSRERRTICDAQHGSVLPGKVIGTEGRPPHGDVDGQHAYTKSRIVYDF